LFIFTSHPTYLLFTGSKMSSSNTSQATAPTVVGGTNYSFTSQGTGTVGQLTTASYGAIKIPADAVKDPIAGAMAGAARLSIYCSGGDPCIAFSEVQADGQLVKALFEPDASMQTADLARILTLMMAMREFSGNLAVVGLKPISYIRQHNLERHFRFSVA
jgi:hypothetical protein